MLLAALLLTATVAAEAPVLNTPDVSALAKRFAKREASIAAAAAPAAADACRPQGTIPTAATDAKAGAQRLDQLPPHRHYMTVLRKERGCDVAVIKEDGRNRIERLPQQMGMQRLGGR